MSRAALTRLVGSAPVTVPMLAAVALFVGWSADGAGYAVTTWSPGTLGLLALLGIAATVIPTQVRDLAGPTAIALGALAGFTAWSYASIAWADDQGAAWDGANRTLVFLVVFALFALWRQRPATSAVVLGAWTLGLAGLGVVVALRLPGGDALAKLFVGDRLAEPAGYPNAAAAVWLMAVWPALSLAAARPVHFGLRGLFAASAVVLAGLGLLTVSRGAIFATPIVLAAVCAVLPDRVRRIVTLAPVGAALVACTPALLHVGDRIDDGRAVSDALATASRTLLAAAAVAGLVVGAGAFLEGRARTRMPADRVARVHSALGRAILVAAAVGALGALVVIGNPSTRASNAWHSFKGGYAEVGTGSSRLTGGLGSNRYDFYRVDLDLFLDHPVTGIGADNFGQDYLVRGRSDETPRYPHSIELRALAQTGLVGALLLAVAIGAAAWSAVGVARSAEDPLARAVAGGTLAAFAYFLVHGSADWFWEFAGLGAPAWAMLGLACALRPRPPEPFLGRTSLLAGPVALGAAALVTLAAVLSLTGPWLSAREVDRAARGWQASPRAAFDRLRHARSLDPLSDRASLIQGSIALRLGDLPGADGAFAEALRRNPRGAYATLERGAIASTRGDRPAAQRLLTRAVELNPRDVLTRRALQIVRSGQAVDVTKLNAAILNAARPLSAGQG